jgi:membrane-bound lytic murein transglycosylase B
MRRTTRKILGFAVLLATLWSLPAAASQQPFAAWLADFKTEALAKGIRAPVLEAAFAGVEPIPRVIELDRKQPEFTLTFWTYLDRAVSDERVRRGKALLAEHQALLESVERRHGVQGRFLIAFWGLETNFGAAYGSFPMIAAVATLAHDQRRSAFFREQLLAGLQIIQRDQVPVDVKSSWAGAMGNMQFIPTTYRDFAVDFDGDGRRDMWNSLPDAFASAANYLSRSGWDNAYTWGREVTLPAGFEPAHADPGTAKPLAEWRRLGIRQIGGAPLSDVDLDASLVLPAGYQGPAFLVYRNFRAILAWNRSILYAIAVGHLADRLIDLPPLATPRPAQEVPLSRQDIEDMQRLLTAKGFDAGPVDGMVGSQTREAIRGFQKAAGLPADGYPSFGLLERLRGTGG